ncbi:hypothetical protein DMB92_08210 [Campylobacter sp. MIT 99-7217]|uniref:DUF5131 family protein n=1 Tax=Campylobacter sp. MIT 99-7217 TaxID=535091 RepID=UPI001156FF9C|nr:DUF5131 family protein [Campylobacter sp. MIT 99-7217]TQR29335.1 hypothetical protein DMB92_08210 [Campylobacter sp. MIT 99-7217]
MQEFSYNPWHGCIKKSEGCLNCFIYTIDKLHNKDTRSLYKTQNFSLPLAKKRDKSYKIPSNSLIYTCFSSDFLLKEADELRASVWQMMRIRKDCDFIFFTKRIERLQECLPKDWGEGYDNVIIGCSVENQKRADERLDLFLNLAIKRRYIIATPL